MYQFDHVTVRVAQENLRCAIRPQLARKTRRAQRLQVPFPGLEVVHPQGEMIAAVVGKDRFGAVQVSVQLSGGTTQLISAQFNVDLGGWS